ncbi:ERCC4 domain-containing protein [Candidatus Nitrosotalea okcheonensis]|uniref:ERCC4 domain-containing protein n=1 Tax=Candidatus Nitrosotalea okcheonensis TaxID=1903276 RepID=A0A2H1FIG5_9ARCH|nr:ERCC4 domain-containing protein [Candidatus Nitrosotalea okcheonensis]MDE1728026.1 heavy metal resistance protein CzcA [Nitrososphaerota archaeon]MDE1831265.1 heavy metal resistance protein CzcA [Nitrososphaerota archaeon]MDE1841821.1 heavy metal resistance protein CzcA [Nitrososphaerota archaeon]MDE1877343.1 heavy metal resistance protein CzcA [Nitrososphaerota archaeon]SMH72568.1 ERCC4 domain-containing protein [Candidatus Nitrosotalea okcheonensis]
MKINDLRMVIDERERKSGIPDLIKNIGVKVEMMTLPVGDYIVAPETIVERKSVNDFISSVFDGRLFDQCSRLKEHFEHPAIVIEGNVDEIDKITENPLVFYGALSSVILDFKIPVIPTPNASHTAKLLISMCARQDAVKGPFLKKIRKSGDLKQQQLSILCSLPGVGEKLATRMLEKFGSTSNSLNASSVELSKINGMGESRAQKIRKILDTKNKDEKKTDQKTLHDV